MLSILLLADLYKIAGWSFGWMIQNVSFYKLLISKEDRFASNILIAALDSEKLEVLAVDDMHQSIDLEGVSQ